MERMAVGVYLVVAQAIQVVGVALVRLVRFVLAVRLVVVIVQLGHVLFDRVHPAVLAVTRLVRGYDCGGCCGHHQ